MNIQKYAYQRVRTRSERTVRDFLAKIEVFIEVALLRVLVLAVVEVLHDRVLHLLLHVQRLKHIKIIIKKIAFKKRKISTSR